MCARDSEKDKAAALGWDGAVAGAGAGGHCHMSSLSSPGCPILLAGTGGLGLSHGEPSVLTFRGSAAPGNPHSHLCALSGVGRGSPAESRKDRHGALATGQVAPRRVRCGTSPLSVALQGRHFCSLLPLVPSLVCCSPAVLHTRATPQVGRADPGSPTPGLASGRHQGGWAVSTPHR